MKPGIDRKPFHDWKQGDKFQINGSNDRIVYDPSWSESKPFKTYIRGSAGQCFETFGEALRYMGVLTKDGKIFPS